MRRGVRIGVDVGRARTGVASCDSDGILATPVATLPANGTDVSEVAREVRERGAIEVIVGLPRNMDGSEGASARYSRRWARRLARRIAPVPVRLFDERLSTVAAHAQLHEAGRSSRRHRAVVDQVAATVILNNALEAERLTGAPAGELVAAITESQSEAKGDNE
ncbi:Holliday junction resolvase RuvX [Actinotignum schaalii]|uniref:Holliday junction resolvase RuvX n=2 Tax=Actinotignum TaxID=1653174 RepID=UPI00047B67DC|nr:Holliday junction resolvase RuvX [Actinotignum schaalii]AIE82314.1 Holliday junction resolvase [Actinotignum schaalii]WQN44354.1 Holliday junction resolvase RuvX [Actinotignum schaalii]